MSALIGAIGSIVGGLLGKPEKGMSPGDQLYSVVHNARRAADDVGFNPLTVLQTAGSGGYAEGPPTSNAYLGAAVADASMLLADAMAKKQDAKTLAERNAAAAENEALKKRVQSLTIRPKVGGVYARRQATPTTRQALGVSDAGRSAVSGSGVGAVDAAVRGADGSVRPLQTQSPFDSRREVDNASITSSSGVMIVDNPHLPFPLVAPTLDGDEPLQWYDYPSLVAPAAFGFGAWAGQKLQDRSDAKRTLGPVMSIGGKRYAMEKRPKSSEQTLTDRLYSYDWSEVARTSRARRQVRK